MALGAKGKGRTDKNKENDDDQNRRSPDVPSESMWAETPPAKGEVGQGKCRPGETRGGSRLRHRKRQREAETDGRVNESWAPKHNHSDSSASKQSLVIQAPSGLNLKAPVQPTTVPWPLIIPHPKTKPKRYRKSEAVVEFVMYKIPITQNTTPWLPFHRKVLGQSSPRARWYRKQLS